MPGFLQLRRLQKGENQITFSALQDFDARHFRLAGLNLLSAIIIFWNTRQLGKAVMQRKRAGLETLEELLKYISPLG